MPTVSCVLPSAKNRGSKNSNRSSTFATERRERRILFDERGDRRIVAGLFGQRFFVVRIAQKADVEEQIEIRRQPVFESESNESNRQPHRPVAHEGGRNSLFERAVGEVGRVDDDVGALPQRGQHAAVGLDRLAYRAGLRERMAPARLAESPHQKVVVGIEKEQTGVIGT